MNNFNLKGKVALITGASRGIGEAIAKLLAVHGAHLILTSRKLEGLRRVEQEIVSKEIINKPTGTVTLFAFDKDQGLSEHTAPFDALVHVLDGEAEILIAGEIHRLRAGEMVIMPGGKPHALRALKQFKMMLIMVRS